jgi:preprotein translocase subunit YajC
MAVEEVAFVVAMAQPAQGQPSFLVQLLPVAMIGAIFYFIILLPVRRRQKKVVQFQADLKVGDKVVTTSGIYGVVSKMGEKSVHIQVSDKVRIEMSRASIGGYQGKDPVVTESGAS